MITVKIEKANASVEFASRDDDTLSDAVRDRVWAYGVKQLLNDAAAPVTVKDLKGAQLVKAQAAALELVNKRRQDLIDGVLRRAREGDAVASEARRIAIKAINKSADFRKWLADNGIKAADKAAVKALSEQADVLMKRADIVAAATKIVATRNELEITL